LGIIALRAKEFIAKFVGNGSAIQLSCIDEASTTGSASYKYKYNMNMFHESRNGILTSNTG